MPKTATLPKPEKAAKRSKKSDVKSSAKREKRDAKQGKGAAKKAAKPAKKRAPQPLYVVADSGIHGKGLFARRKIAKGTVLGAYDGPKVYTDDEDGDHVLWIEDEDGEVYGIDGKNELRYVNHSTRANVVFEGEELVAMRDIAKGEELTHHYGDDWEDL